MKSERILITGCNGQLGKTLQELSNEFPDHQFYFTDIENLDITNLSSIRSYLKEHQISVIINAAGYTAVDKAEDETALAYLVNMTAVQNLATAAKELNSLLVHISTDYVFDGESSVPYKTTDQPHPISIYGKSKLAGEEEILKVGGRSVIIRISWLYSLYGNNFVKTMLRLSKKNGEIKVVSDQWGSPTNAMDLSRVIMQIVTSEKEISQPTIYHYSNAGKTNWYEFTKKILDLSESQCKLAAISTSEYATKAKRPKFSLFDHTKIIKEYAITIPKWEESLQRDIEKIKENTDCQ